MIKMKAMPRWKIKRLKKAYPIKINKLTNHKNQSKKINHKDQYNLNSPMNHKRII